MGGVCGHIRRLVYHEKLIVFKYDIQWDLVRLDRLVFIGEGIPLLYRQYVVFLQDISHGNVASVCADAHLDLL